MRFRPPTGLIVTLATVAVIAWGIHSSEQKRLSQVAKPTRSGPPCTTLEGWHYAATEAALDKASRFVAQGDKAAFAKLITTGTLRPLAAGVAVYLEPGGGISHAAIRLPGETGHVWVLQEALTCAR